MAALDNSTTFRLEVVIGQANSYLSIFMHMLAFGANAWRNKYVAFANYSSSNKPS